MPPGVKFISSDVPKQNIAIKYLACFVLPSDARAAPSRQGSPPPPPLNKMLYTQIHNSEIIAYKLLHVWFSFQTYVQHLIGQLQSQVWELLSNLNTHIYVCGDSAMGEEVKAEVSLKSYGIQYRKRQVLCGSTPEIYMGTVWRRLDVRWPLSCERTYAW